MRVLRTTMLLALVLPGVGCGLPSSYYLSPPIQGPAALDQSSGIFQISSTSSYFESEFRGFELYYKFYTSPPSGAEINLGGSSNDVATLTTAGYLTVCSGDVTRDSSPDHRTLPLIPIDPLDRALAFTVTVTVDPIEPTSVNFSYSTVNSPSITGQINRHVLASPSGCKPFTFAPGNYNDIDPDATGEGFFSSLTGDIYLAMYAVSYGLQDASSPIYSYPVYLGYLHLSSFSQ